MDQFCAVKDENYRRCSCSDKIYELDEQQQVLLSAADQINEFNANLKTVAMTTEQATSMRNASEGEAAMEADKSGSKRLLDAIMNSISGNGETKVGGGSLEKLNSVNFDSGSGMFGATNNGQQIALYNGKALYTAIYGQCRNVVRENCSDDALQRAVTAYLMAIENDCGTVSKMLSENRKKMTDAVQESNAKLNLARVDNRQTHNASDASTCMNEVEAAIKNEQVCGENYKKCLDNGEFINKDTGMPFTGVTNFYELANLLSFDQGASITDQKLTSIAANKTFVQNFVSRNKKFAETALDKCTDISDQVWSDYLDKAMLEIHYAQIAKVDEVKHGCFDFVRECYVEGKKSVTDFMKNVIDVSGASLKPETTSLTSQLCTDYVQSCDKLFGGEIVSDYIAKIDTKDILTTCRNVAKECFDSYGGTGYSNFYNPASGLFKQGEALDWFTLYIGKNKDTILSPCAKQLMEISECSSDSAFLQKIFGGVDKLEASSNGIRCFDYGLIKSTTTSSPLSCENIRGSISPMGMRETGVATEIYNIISGKLRSNCSNYNGTFIEFRYLDSFSYCTRNSTSCTISGATPCRTTFGVTNSAYFLINRDYNFTAGENVCPIGYTNIVDTQSWGICSCWNNGGRRPDNTTNGKPGCYQTVPNISGETPVNVDNKVCPRALPLVTIGGKSQCQCIPGSTSQCVGITGSKYYDTTTVPSAK
jgi:hypothetical protein